MTCYRVSFFRELLSSDGHPYKCLQQTIDVRRARNPDRAMLTAERRFERRHHVAYWTLCADFVELEIDGKKTDAQPVFAGPCHIRCRDVAGRTTWVAGAKTS